MLNLKQYSNRYQLFYFIKRTVFTVGPAHRSAQAGFRPGWRLRRPASWPAQAGARPGTGPSQPALWPVQAGGKAGRAGHARARQVNATTGVADTVTTRGPTASAHGTGTGEYARGGEGRFRCVALRQLQCGGAATEWSPERCMHRRRAAAYGGYGDADELGGEERSGHVPERRKLTLSVMVRTARSGVAGRRRELARRRRPEAERNGGALAVEGAPARFNWRGGTGRRGEGDGVVCLVPGCRNRRLP